MITHLQATSWNNVLLKLNGQVPVYLGGRGATAETYAHYRDEIRRFAAEIAAPLRRLATQDTDGALLQETMTTLVARYPFAELLYTLNGEGIQSSENVLVGRDLEVRTRPSHRGRDRSARPYYQQAKGGADDVVVTAPYVSTATGEFCLSIAVRAHDADAGTRGYTVLDVHFDELIGHLARRRRRPMRLLALAAGGAVAVSVAVALVLALL